MLGIFKKPIYNRNISGYYSLHSSNEDINKFITKINNDNDFKNKIVDLELSKCQIVSQQPYHNFTCMVLFFSISLYLLISKPK